ncbi:ATP-binding protein [Fibrella sp. WM1]
MKCTDKILGTFQRLNSKGEFSGTGIGLAICRCVVENHQGCIAAESQLNKGAAFTFYCPLSSKERT